mmetsp:Transcript_42821/g.103175  ORF Transcript_42821/g.103175 Transcript_42821/m.103175 type:complete len:291 (+) Transcript_42821:4766-5638(+)
MVPRLTQELDPIHKLTITFTTLRKDDLPLRHNRNLVPVPHYKLVVKQLADAAELELHTAGHRLGRVPGEHKRAVGISEEAKQEYLAGKEILDLVHKASVQLPDWKLLIHDHTLPPQLGIQQARHNADNRVGLVELAATSLKLLVHPESSVHPFFRLLPMNRRQAHLCNRLTPCCSTRDILIFGEDAVGRPHGMHATSNHCEEVLEHIVRGLRFSELELGHNVDLEVLVGDLVGISPAHHWLPCLERSDALDVWSPPEEWGPSDAAVGHAEELVPLHDSWGLVVTKIFHQK